MSSLYREETVVKELHKEHATSILCREELLRHNSRLVLVGQNRENMYYRVKNTNTVLLHIEDDFCVLTDYVINGNNLVQKMQQEHYGVYQLARRDWVKNSATSRAIGYDIKIILHGIGCRKSGMTLDHEDATFDEREKVKSFSYSNFNDGSHRVCVSICTQGGLNQFIDRLIQNDSSPKGLYF
jgi:hypothetical protein